MLTPENEYDQLNAAELSAQDEIAQDEIAQVEQEIERSAAQRRRVFPRAALVGFLVGLVAVAFRLALDGVQELRLKLVEYAHQFGVWGVVISAVASAILAAAGVYLVQQFAPEASGSGIPHLQAVLHGWKKLRPWRLIPIKFGGGAMAIGAGLGLGREGPTVQMGGAIAQIIAQKTNALPEETRALLAAGAGAGLAAAFNAPLAGMIFVLEEIQRDFSPIVFSAGFVACIVGDVVSRVLMGTDTAFHTSPLPLPATGTLPLFALLGAIAGILGVAFNRGIMGSLKLVDSSVKLRSPHGLAMLGGIAGFVVGSIGYFQPNWVGSGHHLAELTIENRIALAIIPALFLLRFLISIGSYSTGAAGGVFAPLLGLGALLGLGVAHALTGYFPAGFVDPKTFAVVGMAAYFTSIVRAPLTGILLIAEMTGGYELFLPLLIACFASYGIAEWLKELPLYESLLEYSLQKSASPAILPGSNG